VPLQQPPEHLLVLVAQHSLAACLHKRAWGWVGVSD
jgi:hypothetical protein